MRVEYAKLFIKVPGVPPGFRFCPRGGTPGSVAVGVEPDMQSIACLPLPRQPLFGGWILSTIMLGQTWPLPMGTTRKIVAISLSDQANDQGVCWPSVGSMERRTGLSDRAIQQAIGFLEASGFMAVERRTGRSTIYHLTPERYSPPNDIHPTPERPSETPEAGSPTPEPRSPITIKNHQGTVIEPSSAFEKWWEVYPRKIGRKPAEKIWRSRKLDSIGDRLVMDTTYRVLNDAAWKDKQFIPHPTTYLNQERWNDEVQRFEDAKPRFTFKTDSNVILLACRERNIDTLGKTRDELLRKLNGPL